MRGRHPGVGTLWSSPSAVRPTTHNATIRQGEWDFLKAPPHFAEWQMPLPVCCLGPIITKTPQGLLRPTAWGLQPAM